MYMFTYIRCMHRLYVLDEKCTLCKICSTRDCYETRFYYFSNTISVITT